MTIEIVNISWRDKKCKIGMKLQVYKKVKILYKLLYVKTSIIYQEKEKRRAKLRKFYKCIKE